MQIMGAWIIWSQDDCINKTPPTPYPQQSQKKLIKGKIQIEGCSIISLDFRIIVQIVKSFDNGYSEIIRFESVNPKKSQQKLIKEKIQIKGGWIILFDFKIIVQTNTITSLPSAIPAETH